MQDVTLGPERWLPILGFEGLYEVSDQGGVRSIDRVVPGPKREGGVVFPRRLRGQLLKQGHLRPPAKPYKTVSLSKNGRHYPRLVHRLVALAFAGLPQPGDEVCHDNGDCTDNRLGNLRWDTRPANQRDAVAHGTHSMTKKTRCPLGHLLVAPNLYPSRLPDRICIACGRAKARRQTARRKGLSFDLQKVSDAFFEQIMTSSAPAV